MISQKGSAHAFLTIGLIAALICALGFIFWQNFLDPKPASRSESTNSSNRSTKKLAEKAQKTDEQKIEASLKASFPNILVKDVEIIESNAHGSIVLDDNGGMFWARKVEGVWKTYGVGADDYVGNATALRYDFPKSKACNSSSTNSCWYYSDIDDSDAAKSYPSP